MITSNYSSVLLLLMSVWSLTFSKKSQNVLNSDSTPSLLSRYVIDVTDPMDIIEAIYRSEDFVLLYTTGKKLLLVGERKNEFVEISSEPTPYHLQHFVELSSNVLLYCATSVYVVFVNDNGKIFLAGENDFARTSGQEISNIIELEFNHSSNVFNLACFADGVYFLLENNEMYTLGKSVFFPEQELISVPRKVEGYEFVSVECDPNICMSKGARINDNYFTWGGTTNFFVNLGIITVTQIGNETYPFSNRFEVYEYVIEKQKAGDEIVKKSFSSNMAAMFFESGNFTVFGDSQSLNNGVRDLSARLVSHTIRDFSMRDDVLTVLTDPFCTPGYFGENCGVWTCGNYKSYESEVCYSRGVCSALHKCDCQKEMYGSLCEEFVKDAVLEKGVVYIPYVIERGKIDWDRGHEACVDNFENPELIGDTGSICKWIFDEKDESIQYEIKLGDFHLFNGSSARVIRWNLQTSNETIGIRVYEIVEPEITTPVFLLPVLLGSASFLFILCVLLVVLVVIIVVLYLKTQTKVVLAVQDVDIFLKDDSVDSELNKEDEKVYQWAREKFKHIIINPEELSKAKLDPGAARGSSAMDIVRCQYLGTEVVVKKYKVQMINRNIDKDALKEALMETDKMKNFNAPKIVSFFGIVLEKHLGYSFWMVMEACDMNLKTFLKKFPNLRTEKKIEILQAICHGMSHLHSKDCLHRDLKLDNILVNVKKRRGPEIEIKLCDLGLSKIVKDVQALSESTRGKGKKSFFRLTQFLSGTSGFISPEITSSGKYSSASDVSPIF